ncbi:MAG TPA: hypothetical protein PKC43_01940 [Phycisphaerales bacterium]|nr:hypothetical protein [Phycisphaerales bacterium]HMP36186.1 hypothetical protein [Phycisphaerales bacterium]
MPIHILRGAGVVALLGLCACGAALALSLRGPPPAALVFGMQSSLVVAIGSVPAVACANMLLRARLRSAMWFGLAAAVASMALWIAVAVADGRGEDPRTVHALAALAAMTTIPALVLGAVAGLLRRRPVAPMERWGTGLAIVAWTLLVALGGTLAIGGFTRLAGGPDFSATIQRHEAALAMLGVASAGGFLTGLTLVAVGQSRRTGARSAGPSDFAVSVTCPRCGVAQTIAGGGASCQGCRLRIVVEAA